MVMTMACVIMSHEYTPPPPREEQVPYPFAYPAYARRVRTPTKSTTTNTCRVTIVVAHDGVLQSSNVPQGYTNSQQQHASAAAHFFFAPPHVATPTQSYRGSGR